MYNITPIIYIVCMKKIFLTLALAALSTYAADCLRNVFDIHEKTYGTAGIANGMVIDSVFLQYRDPQHSVEFDNTKYYRTGEKIDSAINYRKNHDSDDWEITVQRADDSLTYHREVTQDGNFIKIITTGGTPHMEELIYQENDSINYVTKYISPETGEVTDSYEAISVLRNDTIYKSENNGDDCYIIVRDSANENKCYEKNNLPDFRDIDAIYEFEMKGDTLIDTETRPGGYQSTFMIFFVPLNGSSSAIVRKNRPNFARPKTRSFDLLGRPAKGKYTVQFLK